MTVTTNDKELAAEIRSTIMDTYVGKTILITGGRGYIGSSLTQVLAKVNCKLILLDKSPEYVWMPEHQKAKVRFFYGDVSRKKTWESILPGIDYVFHLAAEEYFYRSGYEPEKDLKSNALPILHLLEICRIQKYRPSIVFASSANLFGLIDRLPVNEDNLDDPLTVWAVHKLTAEHYLRLYSQKYGINSVSLRLANVYGPTVRWSVNNRVVLNKVIAKAIDGGGLTTYSNRKCVRDFLFLKDAVKAFLFAGAYCESNERPFYVIGSGEGETIANIWHLIADSIRAHTRKNIPIRPDESVKLEPLELRSFVANTDLFQKTTGWKPQTTLSQGIDITVREFLSKSGSFL